MANPRSILDRLAARSRRAEDGCLVWAGFVDRDGYGVIKVDGKSRRAHRVSFEAHNGQIPDGMVIRHECDNPACFDPAHLVLGTHADNIRDMDERNRRTCQIGEDNNGAKITAEQAKAVFSDPRPASVVAREYGVGRKNVGEIRRRKSWASVTDALEMPEYQNGRLRCG